MLDIVFAGLVIGAEHAGFQTSGPPEVCYLTEPRHGAAVDIEARIPVISDAPRLTSGLARRPGGKVAHVCHEGPYEDIADACNALYVWVHRAGYEVVGSPAEVYLAGPADTSRPEDYLTEVVVPVRRCRLPPAG
ncbi:GyrI-like domain-containing protein [Lentzea sp. BCCO 10_0856]|uniref:GyrI-like domain-containing protein n=1 Tax=Lentzea miocenica TaxID=3095431 RepID=A0ABU4TA57_9PSEU|nr:GyrI-like domain-containing protein [Lentzea sp. BCCO 10_0856]MDX8034944.1 GyrI-like domain-containing protein [Lentzea sp. BCCO 10_0856]